MTRRYTISIAILLIAAACAGDEANKPAVIQAPPIVLPSDTAKPDTSMMNRQLRDRITQELVLEYAVIGAAVSFGDKRMLETMYATDAELRIGGATFKTGISVAFALADMARANSIKEMGRTTRRVVVFDSVVVDSGDYAIRSQRPGGASTVERGTYAATWLRPLGTPAKWTILRDELIPAPAKARPTEKSKAN